jgi:hypothetical protein
MTDDEIAKRIAALNELCDNLKQDCISGGGDESFALDTQDLLSIPPSMISPLTSSQISTITVGGGGAYGSSSGNMWTTTTSSPGSTYISSPITTTTTMPGIGHTMPGGAGTYYTSGPGGPTWTGTTTSNANLRITGKNPKIQTDKSEIDLDETAELIKILKERLLILIPNFEKQEKYQALKKAYDHYKMIEALIQEEKIDVPK